MGILFNKVSNRIKVEYEVHTVSLGAKKFPVEELVAMTDPELRTILTEVNTFEDVKIPEAQLFSLLYDFGRV